MADSCVLFDDVPEHESEHLSEGKAPRAHLSPRSSYPCAVPGINLNDYSKNAQQKGWGAPCSQAHTTVTLSSGVRVTVASGIAELVGLVMNNAIARGYAFRQADTGAYVCRYISGTTVWSNHASGLAIDTNWQTNPQRKPIVSDQPVWLLQLWNRYGFANGIDYVAPTTPDAMHHEFMGTPAQAVAATNLARAELGGGTPPPPPADDSAVIRQRQFNLNDSGFPVVVDGVWGPASVQACKNFQRAAHLVVDGVYGPAVEAALRKVPSWKYTAFGGQPVRTWQQQLVNHGWHLTVDGVWGAHSVSICQQFQRDKQLATQDGSPSPDTWTALHCTVN